MLRCKVYVILIALAGAIMVFEQSKIGFRYAGF